MGGNCVGIRPGMSLDKNIHINQTVVALCNFWDDARSYDSLDIHRHFVIVYRIFINMTKIVHVLKEESRDG